MRTKEGGLNVFQIKKKRILNPTVKYLEIYAPLIAKKAEPGQFIILRVNEKGERIPLTIADYNRKEGTVTIVFQEVGATTRLLGTLKEGESILDFTGPLGVPSHYENIKKAAVIGGGLGTAIAYPQAKKLHNTGAHVDAITGFRTDSLIFFKEEMEKVSDRLYVTTDDGSNGRKGFVTQVLKELLEQGNDYDLAIAIGPLVMMKSVSDMTKEAGIKTIVSMNPVMIDGTGMCGGCRVTVDGEIKFACVDGPDFDGHLVDFDEAMRRQQMYKKEEKACSDKHECRLEGSLNA